MTPGVRPLIAGNWKMHGLRADGLALARAVAEGAGGGGGRPSCWSARPSPCSGEVAAALDGGPVAVGAQDCHAAAKGAHTGDVAAPMLRDAGARFVILGHSERRADHGETDAAVRAKAEAAIAAGPGADRLRRRERGGAPGRRGRGGGDAPARRQPAGRASPRRAAWWPTSRSGPSAPAAPRPRPTSPPSTPRSAPGSRARFGDGGRRRLRILYGGSVKPANAAAILALENVDGALVGGASLVAADFLAIAAAAKACLTRPCSPDPRRARRC